MRFYLGTHKVGWLTRSPAPLFISHRQARTRRTPLRATVDWALDSGGYTELSTHGAWQTTVAEYVDAVAYYADVWGRLQWAAPQDWMTEPWVLARTGKSIAEHLDRTVENFLQLDDTGLPFVPVLQGQTLDDYLGHVALYASAGVDLASRPLVGVGSVCRREGTSEAEAIFRALGAHGLTRLHGFGVKTSGLRRYASCLTSADSMAWSIGARHEANRLRKLGRPYACAFGGTHEASCSNCIAYALDWRAKVISSIGTEAP